jgi:predicted DsbA family dithiol-disulfide isomerase
VAGFSLPEVGVARRRAGRQGGSESGKFREYHDLLYENQFAKFSDERLVELAREAGLDVEEFESDRASGTYEEAVARDFQEGQRMGISGTPTFIINGKVLAGFQPVGVFEDAIERAKSEAGQEG